MLNIDVWVIIFCIECFYRDPRQEKNFTSGMKIFCCQVNDKVSVSVTARCTWMSGHRAWDAVVAVKKLFPQELISGDSQPLPACQTSSQHSIMGQTHEDLQHQAVRQNWATLHPIILQDIKGINMTMISYIDRPN